MLLRDAHCAAPQVLSERQCGSTFKPLIFLAALEAGVVKPSTLLSNRLATYRKEGRAWVEVAEAPAAAAEVLREEDALAVAVSDSGPVVASVTAARLRAPCAVVTLQGRLSESAPSGEDAAASRDQTDRSQRRAARAPPFARAARLPNPAASASEHDAESLNSVPPEPSAADGLAADAGDEPVGVAWLLRLLGLAPQADAELYQPQNCSGEHGGDVTAQQALVQSLNIPCVRLAHAVGIANGVHLSTTSDVRWTLSLPAI